MYTTAFAIFSLFTLSRSCNYVRDPNWELEYWQENNGNWELQTYTERRQGPVPLGYCQTNAGYDSDGNDYSEIFLCTAWNQIYHFSWNTTDCMGTPKITEVVSNSGYQCQSTETCQIFNVRSNLVDSDAESDCVANTESYDEMVLVAEECFVERDDNDDGTVSWRSIKAECTDSGVSYQIYPDVIDCTGDYNEMYSVVADDGDCAMAPDGDNGQTLRYISVLNCGEVTPQDASPYAQAIADADCSYVANAQFYNEYETCWDDVNNVEIPCDPRTYDVSTPMAGNMDADQVCTKRYEFSEDGDTYYYSSQLIFCADVIQMAFIASWADEDSINRCQGPPSFLTPIIGYTSMGCNNVAGPCDNMLLRISEFEDNDGAQECGYNANNEWNEIRITTGKCWLADADTSTYVEGRCEVNSDVPSGSYNIFAVDDGTCSGDADYTLPLADGGCYDFEAEPLPIAQPAETGNYSNIQILSCNGDYLSADQVIPDCKYVESPVWTEEFDYFDTNSGQWMQYEDVKNYYEGFKVPIGECLTNMRPDGADSRIFICTPWNQVVVFEFFGDDCTDLSALSAEPNVIEGSINNCASENYCRDTDTFMKVISNPTGAGCYRNDSNYDMNSFVPGCTNKDPVTANGTGSTYVKCDDDANTVDYIVYDQPGCQGNELLNVDLDTDMDTAVDGLDNCDDFGPDNPMFVELLECGDQESPEITGCSYIINPTWNQSEGGFRQREGAMPLSTDICVIELNDDVGLVSYMYWCNPDVDQAFIAWWNGTAGCSGYPDDVEIIWPGVEGGFQCTGDNGANCEYGFVTTSTVDSADEDDCMLGADIEQSARILDMCWYSYDDGSDDSGSWTWAPTTTSYDKSKMTTTSMDTTSISTTSMDTTPMDTTSMVSTSFMAGYNSWIVDCGVNAITGEYELEIKYYEGKDCGDDGGELLNQIYIDDNECVAEFNDVGTQTYFDIGWCTKNTPIDGRPTEEPPTTTTEATTTEEVVSFCESVDQVEFGADGIYTDDSTSFIDGLLQAKCEYCICYGDTDGNGFNQVCEVIADIFASDFCTYFIEGCAEAKEALTDAVGCPSFDDIEVLTDDEGFKCGLQGFKCKDTNTSDANILKVSIISLFSVFIFAIYN